VWEGTQLEELTSTDQRGIPYATMSCSAIKFRERRRKGEECLELWCLSFQVIVMHDGALVSWKWLNVCLLMGNSE